MKLYTKLYITGSYLEWETSILAWEIILTISVCATEVTNVLHFFQIPLRPMWYWLALCYCMAHIITFILTSVFLSQIYGLPDKFFWNVLFIFLLLQVRYVIIIQHLLVLVLKYIFNNFLGDNVLNNILIYRIGKTYHVTLEV